MPVANYYKLLQVDPEAELDVIRAAFEVLVARLDPERDRTGVHDVRLRELRRAFETLADPGRRRVYDIERSATYGMVMPGELIGIPIEEPEPVAVAAGAEPPSARGRSATGEAADVDGHGGSSVLNFGRFAGLSLREIAATDTEYLRWLSRHSSGIRYRMEIEALLRNLGEQL
ncbi:MAG TPA: DnaJ domain-containing protein [Candidatus Limnocylindria bacterium]|jgi:curved DNA-binding protein CbpA